MDGQHDALVRFAELDFLQRAADQARVGRDDGIELHELMIDAWPVDAVHHPVQSISLQQTVDQVRISRKRKYVFLTQDFRRRRLHDHVLTPHVHKKP